MVRAAVQSLLLIQCALRETTSCQFYKSALVSLVIEVSLFPTEHFRYAFVVVETICLDRSIKFAHVLATYGSPFSGTPDKFGSDSHAWYHFTRLSETGGGKITALVAVEYDGAPAGKALCCGTSQGLVFPCDK